MSKLTNEQKIEIFEKKAAGQSIKKLAIEYGINARGIVYYYRLIKLHGPSILRQNQNRYYSKELKQEIIDKVLIENQSITNTALEYGLANTGMLSNWIRSYKENGYVIVEKQKGRRATMKKEIKSVDPNDKDAIIKAKDNEILRLKAEVEYLKKLHAVVQARKNQQSKKK